MDFIIIVALLPYTIFGRIYAICMIILRKIFSGL